MLSFVDTSGLTELVVLCSQGDHAAWQRLIYLFDPPLRDWIAARLRRKRVGAILVDDVAEEVWFTLWSVDGCGLRRFDPLRGGFEEYLRGVARRQVDRAIWRRRAQESARKPLKSRELVDWRAQESSVEFAVSDLLSSLRPSTSAFVQEHLLECDCADVAPALSAANVRKIKQRLWVEVKQALGQERPLDPVGSRHPTHPRGQPNSNEKAHLPCSADFYSDPLPQHLPSSIWTVFVAWVSASRSAPTDRT